MKQNNKKCRKIKGIILRCGSSLSAKLTFLKSVIQQQIASNNMEPDPFYAQATKFLANAAKNRDNLSQALPSKQYAYIWFCILNIDNPHKICTYLNSSIKQNSQNLRIIVKALYAVSVLYMDNSTKRPEIEKIYKLLLEDEKIRKYLLQNLEIPSDLRRSLKLDESISNLCECLPTIDKSKQGYYACQLPNIKATTKLLVILSEMKESSSAIEHQTLWKQVVSVIGETQLTPVTKLIDVITSTIISQKKMKLALFLFQKLAQAIGKQIIFIHLLSKEAAFNCCNESQVRENQPLPSLFDDYATNGIPDDSNILVFALLAKHQLFDYKQVFLKLTPGLNELLLQCVERQNNYYTLLNNLLSNQFSKLAGKSQQLTDCRKQDFLTQLILMNAVQPYKKLVQEFKLNLMLLNHPPLFFAFSQLLEWLIDPLYEVISFSRFFPKAKKTDMKTRIPEGTLTQLHVIDLTFIDRIWELLLLSGPFIFARRSTFVKFCRLLQGICKADEKIKTAAQDGPKIFGFISKCLVKYVIPAIQFYSRDYSVIYSLNNVLECFTFKYQQQLLLQTAVNRQSQPLQLLSNMFQGCQQLNVLLNRIAKNNEHIIEKQIKTIVEDRPLSALYELFKRLVVRGTTSILKNVIKIIIQSHPLVKKCMITYLFLHLLQHQQSLVNKDSTFTEEFSILIQFISEFLVSQSNSSDLIKLLLEYLVVKLQPSQKKFIDMSNLQFFRSYIVFFDQIIKFLLPIQIDSLQNQGQNKDLKFAKGGICLKVLFFKTIDSFIKSREARKNLCKLLLEGTNPFQTKLYIILIRLSQHTSAIPHCQDYNISHLIYLSDRIHNLTYQLIQLVHLEAGQENIKQYFSFGLFDRLLNHYHVPLKICFTLLRKGIFCEYAFDRKEQFLNQNDWKTIKINYGEAIESYLANKVVETQFKLKNWSVDCYSLIERQKILKSDIFLLFWVLPFESCIKKKKAYQKCIKRLSEDIKSAENEQQAQNRKAFLVELQKQQKWNASTPYVSDILHSVQMKQCFSFASAEEQQNFFKMFIKNCVISRALISQSDTHFAWYFLLNFLQKCQVTTKTFFKTICQLRLQICAFLIFQTHREASEILPLLANLPNYFTQFWYNRGVVQKRLQQYKFLTLSSSKKDYEQVIRVIQGYSKKIVASLTQQRSKQTQCTAKNILQFICLARFVPMFKDQAKTINLFLDQIGERYDTCTDIITKLERAKKIIADRQKQISSHSIQQISQYFKNKPSKSTLEKNSKRPSIGQQEKASNSGIQSQTIKQAPVFYEGFSFMDLAKDQLKHKFEMRQQVQSKAIQKTKSQKPFEGLNVEKPSIKSKSKKQSKPIPKEVISIDVSSDDGGNSIKQ